MRPTLRHVLARSFKSGNFQRRYSSNLSGYNSSKRLQLFDDEQSKNDDGTSAGANSGVEFADWAEKHWSKHSPASTIRRSFSGIQPTGVPHLGNYLGALRQWKQLHDQASNPKFALNYRYEQYFSVVDLHALTSDIPGPERARLRKESYAALLAIGLRNNSHTTLFFQSDVWQHTYLMWILSTVASTGYLSRMTQWKNKLNLPENANLDSDETTARLKLGLFSYPVLQAADILLYQPSIVPVGEDQLQHIEFTRTLARGFNAHVKKDVFRIPWPVISPAKRIMSLKRPEHKMSKSDPDPKSRILITDSHEDIHAKLRGAVTDSDPGISFDPERRPGVSNLVEILKHVTESRESSEYIAKDNANVSMRAFKEMIANEIIAALGGIREEFHEIMASKNNLQLRENIEHGSKKARQKARTTLDDVQQALGLEGLALTNEESAYRRERSKHRAPKQVGADLAIETNPFEAQQDRLEEDFIHEDDEDDDDLVKGGPPKSIRRGTK